MFWLYENSDTVSPSDWRSSSPMAMLSPTRMAGDVPNVTVIVVSPVHAQYAPEPRYAFTAAA